MRTPLWHLVIRNASLLAMLTLTACDLSTWPTGDDIEQVLLQQTATVGGAWRGNSTGRDLDLLTLQVTLTQSGTAVSGSGVMEERGVVGTRPVTVTGTYFTPDATLTISGMQFEGRAVSGALRARNIVGILADTLVLTGENYQRKLAVFMTRQ